MDDVLGFFGTVLSSIFGGGVTGIFGVLAQRFFDLKKYKLDLEQSKLKYEHEINLRKVDAEIMQLEYAGRTKVAEVEADAKAFAASFNEPVKYSEGVAYSGKQGWLMVILDFVRGLVRPVLTTYLCVLTTLIYFHARTLLKADGLQAISAEMSVELVKYIISTILYLTTTCVLWYFGTRNRVKKLGTGN